MYMHEEFGSFEMRENEKNVWLLSFDGCWLRKEVSLIEMQILRAKEDEKYNFTPCV